MKKALLFSVLSLLLLLFTVLLLGHSKGPPAQRTGGFNQDTCISCHNSFDLNEGRTVGGVFHIGGVPQMYSGGTSYPIIVVISHPGQTRWGFQLSARFTSSGEQAGQLVAADEFTAIKEEKGIQYVEHTELGTRKGAVNGLVEFRVNWMAPDPPRGDVFFNAAGNAADGNEDPKGDYIYTAGGYSIPAGMTAPVPPAARRPATQVPITDFSNRLVNIPTTRAIRPGLMEFFIAHRFNQPIFPLDESADDLFGLDSSANIVFGFNYGLAKGIGISAYRSRAWRTIDLAGEFSLLQQSKERATPVSLLVRTGVAGRDNFGLSPTKGRPNRHHFSPYIQISASRLFTDRLALYAVPMAVFNSQDDFELLFAPPGVDRRHEHTLSLGLGGSLRLTPTVAVVGEYVPRLGGFRAINFDRPAVSVGIQKNTSGHAFELVFSTASGLAPNEYAIEGSDTFRIGFNIYRRLRR